MAIFPKILVITGAIEYFGLTQAKLLRGKKRFKVIRFANLSPL
jgi:hypothetical protein